MSRIARVVIPEYPHHITQRGARRMKVFFEDSDYEMYLRLMRKWCTKKGIVIWAYCLMPNHVHMIAVPEKGDSLYKGIGQAHRLYAKYINERNEWKGHLWQERFSSFLMDYPHLVTATRYIEQNPVLAGLAEKPSDWPWSSARAHISGTDDMLVKTAPLLEKITDSWEDFIAMRDNDKARSNAELIRRHEKTGRPLGSESFLETVEQETGYFIKKRKPGPKKTFLDLHSK